jgi:hypothetical protein
MPVEQFLGCTRRLQFKTGNAGRQLFTVASPLRNQAKIISHVSVAERKAKTRYQEGEKVFSFLRSQMVFSFLRSQMEVPLLEVWRLGRVRKSPRVGSFSRWT